MVLVWQADRHDLDNEHLSPSHLLGLSLLPYVQLRGSRCCGEKGWGLAQDSCQWRGIILTCFVDSRGTEENLQARPFTVSIGRETKPFLPTYFLYAHYVVV